MNAHQPQSRPDAAKVLNALAQPLLTVDVHGMVIEVNAAAETFFDMGRAALLRSRLSDLIPPTRQFWRWLLTRSAIARLSTATKSTFPRPGLGIEPMWMFSSRPCRRRTTPSRLCCKNGPLPKK